MNCLGLDTSCYTTSVALCDASGLVFCGERKLLSVPLGRLGLAQSQGVFQHGAALPELLDRLLARFRGDHPGAGIQAICASTRPRPKEDSYMPVFRVGEGYGRALASALEIPFYETTHQAGHLRAARVDTALPGDAPFLALHLSGGTTEILRAEGEDCRLLGGTEDLHAGQLIDRIGVAMGLPFPAGPKLEQLAMKGRAASRIKATVQGLSCHLSGAEREALALLEEAAIPREDVAAEVFDGIARAATRLILHAHEETGLWDALLFGGVMASRLLRERITERLVKRNRGIRLHFGRPDLSGDNAAGVALLGAERLLKHTPCNG